MGHWRRSPGRPAGCLASVEQLNGSNDVTVLGGSRLQTPRFLSWDIGEEFPAAVNLPEGFLCCVEFVVSEK